MHVLIILDQLPLQDRHAATHAGDTAVQVCKKPPFSWQSQMPRRLEDSSTLWGPNVDRNPNQTLLLMTYLWEEGAIESQPPILPWACGACFSFSTTALRDRCPYPCVLSDTQGHSVVVRDRAGIWTQVAPIPTSLLFYNTQHLKHHFLHIAFPNSLNWM